MVCCSVCVCLSVCVCVCVAPIELKQQLPYSINKSCYQAQLIKNPGKQRPPTKDLSLASTDTSTAYQHTKRHSSFYQRRISTSTTLSSSTDRITSTAISTNKEISTSTAPSCDQYSTFYQKAPSPVQHLTRTSNSHRHQPIKYQLLPATIYHHHRR